MRKRSPSRHLHSPLARRHHRDSSGYSTDSSSSSSSSSSSFHSSKRRHRRSLDSIRPINDPGTLAQVKGSLRADAAPVGVDTSVNWDSVGGLQHHVLALKEMIMLPMLYPEAFAQLNIQPPRGVLFVGPPGTGKTLVARALCNSCSVVGSHRGCDV